MWFDLPVQHKKLKRFLILIGSTHDLYAKNIINVSVAERVVDRGQMQLCGCQLEISMLKEKPMVKITGITSAITYEILRLLFENTKRSGGGDIKECTSIEVISVPLLHLKR